MLRLAFAFILLLLMLFGGAVWLLDIGQQPPAPEQQAKKEAAAPNDGPKSTAEKSEADQLQEALKPPAKPSDGAPGFDIARIDPNGTSVFAGHAEPHSLVTITIDGREIGTAQADENGEWTLTTDAKIPNPDGKLALFKAPPGAVPRVVGDEPQHADAKVSPSPAPAKSQTASTVSSDMLKNLEGMVAAARSEAAPVTQPAAPPPAPAAVAEPPGGTAALPPAAPSAAPSTTVPLPITFVFNEATLTSDGSKAAALLLEYLRLKRFPKVTLTGHADERGSDELNIGLSRERLETVAHFLREGGYDGQLDLVPKGKSEPYRGVARSGFSQEDLWQLDRRVELVVTR